MQRKAASPRTYPTAPSGLSANPQEAAAGATVQRTQEGTPSARRSGEKGEPYWLRLPEGTRRLVQALECGVLVGAAGPWRSWLPPQDLHHTIQISDGASQNGCR